jgi:hypothetical protein
MMEEPYILKMNIAHYRAVLTLRLDDNKRAAIQRLLAEAESELALTRDGRATASGAAARASSRRFG